MEGPQDFTNLLLLLKSDPKYGYFALRDFHFEAKIRKVLLENSTGDGQLFIQGYSYKWHAVKQQSVQELIELPITRDNPWLQIGHGHEIVYGIFSPSSLRESQLSNTASYPIKIGRTTRSLTERLFELQTGNHLDLQVGIAVHTQNAASLEAYLHNLLKHRKIIGKGSQSEWFLTTLEFIASHCRFQLDSLSA